MAVACAGLLSMAVGFADRYVPVLADWYTRLAISYLPEHSNQLAASSNDPDAFYTCAKRVAREIEGEPSVATFAGNARGSVQALGDKRYLVTSYMDEALESGSTYRRKFTCTVRREGLKWRVENLTLEPRSGTVAVSVLLPTDQ